MKIKLAVGITLLAFVAIATTIFVASASQPAPSAVTPKNSTSSPSANPSNTVVLSKAEVAKHNSANDCWMIISGKVYDFTNFLSSHPGGAYTMIPYCGADGTAGFQTKDAQPARNHSGGAAALLPYYYLGALNASITPKAGSAIPANPNLPGEGYDY